MGENRAMGQPRDAEADAQLERDMAAVRKSEHEALTGGPWTMNPRRAGEAPVLTIDPAVQGGTVCVENSRVPASVIGGSVFAGDTPDEVAGDFGITRQQVLLCCWWWGDGEQFQRTKQGRAVRKRWGAWIDQAHLHFARMMHPDKLADPPAGGGP
jgi:uncharacterized protein (DUF433 family)